MLKRGAGSSAVGRKRAFVAFALSAAEPARADHDQEQYLGVVPSVPAPTDLLGRTFLGFDDTLNEAWALGGPIQYASVWPSWTS